MEIVSGMGMILIRGERRKRLVRKDNECARVIWQSAKGSAMTGEGVA
jgi:hypothetical protein